MTERNAAVHAARPDRAAPVRKRPIDLAPVLDALRHRAHRRLLAGDFDERWPYPRATAAPTSSENSTGRPSAATCAASITRLVARHDLDEESACRTTRRHARRVVAAGRADVLFDQRPHQLAILDAIERLEIDHLLVAAFGEAARHIEHIGDAAAHPPRSCARSCRARRRGRSYTRSRDRRRLRPRRPRRCCAPQTARRRRRGCGLAARRAVSATLPMMMLASGTNVASLGG